MRKLGISLFSILLVSFISLSICADQNQTSEFRVEIKDFSFQPGSITVPVGTTVTWINHDFADHTITSDDGKFNSGNIMSGAEFKFTFSELGTYAYHCNIHPSMIGVVTVD